MVALGVLLAVAYLHPPEWVEAAIGVGAAAAALATGRLTDGGLRTEVGRLLPVVLFLMAVLVVAECCRAAGLFSAIGTRLASAGGRTFVLAFVVASVVTVVLSLDATVVLLTPVVLAAAAATSVSARPFQLVCVRLANSASRTSPTCSRCRASTSGSAGSPC